MQKDFSRGYQGLLKQAYIERLAQNMQPIDHSYMDSGHAQLRA